MMSDNSSKLNIQCTLRPTKEALIDSVILSRGTMQTLIYQASTLDL